MEFNKDFLHQIKQQVLVIYDIRQQVIDNQFDINAALKAIYLIESDVTWNKIIFRNHQKELSGVCVGAQGEYDSSYPINAADINQALERIR